MLEIKHLSKSFGSKKVINNVSLTVPRGKITILLGHSGVGKSTLLRILNGLETYDNGSLVLDGQPLDTRTVNKTHMVGMVFQQFNLFDHLTVEENITLALKLLQYKSKEEAHAIAHKLLQHYGLADKAKAAIADLSGGQKQRVALARTLALKPTVVCLDEPTSALDPLLTAHVAAIIQELSAQGYIVIVASHDTSLIERLTGTIYLMKEGSIIESAETESFEHHPERYPQINRFVKGNAPED